VTSEAEQCRRLARDFHLMARNLPPGEERSALLKMPEEWDRFAEQREHQMRTRRRQFCLKDIVFATESLAAASGTGTGEERDDDANAFHLPRRYLDT